MTPRQEQFLAALTDLCRHQGAAHYSDVALRLQVSKWTAYDMMTRLEAAGYVERLYEVDGGSSGRSRILFRPVKAEGARGPSDEPASVPADWQSLRPWLLQQADRARRQGTAEVLRDLHQELRRNPSPLAFCALYTAVLLVTLKALSDTLEGAWLIHTLLPLLSAQLGVILFTGAALAVIYQYYRRLPRRIASDVGRYQDALSRLDGERQAALGDLARDLVTRLWDEAALA
ncbi:helix-turn-helix domain-containing protein [Limnochorda pilosa]|uniref:Uncharacterized protein n=1 Tax=Limnochorda pilosa TaxID=1555112 RepID=A0A0K2SG16_LIMPI|nr:hypothetical protein [Limnochorda pilosa]BAS26046.1 hypothetical protein LIP_0189 [Limnochorda pilosa]